MTPSAGSSSDAAARLRQVAAVAVAVAVLVEWIGQVAPPLRDAVRGRRYRGTRSLHEGTSCPSEDPPQVG